MKRILALALALSFLSLAFGPIASAHWPDQAPHQIANLGEFKLEGGGAIKNLKMSYVTHGKLNAVALYEGDRRQMAPSFGSFD